MKTFLLLSSILFLGSLSFSTPLNELAGVISEGGGELYLLQSGSDPVGFVRIKCDSGYSIIPGILHSGPQCEMAVEHGGTGRRWDPKEKLFSSRIQIKSSYQMEKNSLSVYGYSYEHPAQYRTDDRHTKRFYALQNQIDQVMYYSIVNWRVFAGRIDFSADDTGNVEVTSERNGKRHPILSQLRLVSREEYASQYQKNNRLLNPLTKIDVCFSTHYYRRKSEFNNGKRLTLNFDYLETCLLETRRPSAAQYCENRCLDYFEGKNRYLYTISDPAVGKERLADLGGVGSLPIRLLFPDFAKERAALNPITNTCHRLCAGTN